MRKKNQGKKVLVFGYGSIGKKHVRNLLDLGITPYVITKHPDEAEAIFYKNINDCKDRHVEHCIISSFTGRHLEDLEKCLFFSKSIKKILIEKPLEASYVKGKKIQDIARRHGLDICIAYNLRFLGVFDKIGKFINKQKNRIKIIEVAAGQCLKEWRPSRDLKSCYSADRRQGGGVDLDLSHEIDYVLWLFGKHFKKKIIYRSKISELQINSPDFFKLFMDYGKFVVDINLDYIRKPRERYLRIICDNAENLYYNFFTGELKIGARNTLINENIASSYKNMLEAFLNLDKRNKKKLCSIREALNILRVLEV